MASNSGADLPDALQQTLPPAASLPPTAGSLGSHRSIAPPLQAHTGSWGAAPPPQGGSFIASYAPEPEREWGPASLPVGSIQPSSFHTGQSSFHAPPPASSSGNFPPAKGVQGELPPQVASFGYPTKPVASVGSVAMPPAPATMPPRSHPGMGLGQLATIASSGESAALVESGDTTQADKQALPPQQPQQHASPVSAPARLDVPAVSRDNSRASTGTHVPRAASLGALPVEHTGQPQSPQSGVMAPNAQIGTPTLTPSSSRGAPDFMQHTFAPTPFAPAPSPQAPSFAPVSAGSPPFVQGGACSGTLPISTRGPPGPSQGPSQPDAFTLHTPSISDSQRFGTVPWAPGPGPPPGPGASLDGAMKPDGMDRPEQLIMVLGVMTFIGIVFLPMCGGFVLLGDRHFRFWMGWQHPVLVLALSGGTVLLLVLTLYTLYRRASPSVLNEHTMVHIGSVFAMLAGLVAVLVSLPASRDMYITSGLLQNGCSTAVADSLILQAHSKVLYNIRDTPACAAELTVEDCDGWKENRYTAYLRFLEEDMDCGPLCPEEGMLPGNAKPMTPQEAHAYAVGKSKGIHFAESPFSRDVIRGSPAMLQGPAQRLLSPAIPRWGGRPRRHGKGFVRKAPAAFIGASEAGPAGGDFVPGDVVVLTRNSSALENSYDRINYEWRNLMGSMLGKEFRVVEVPQAGIVGLPSPDGSQKGVWYFPSRLVRRVDELMAHPLVTPRKLFSKGETRMSCYPLVATHLKSLAWSFSDPMFWQGVCLLAVSVLASSIAFMTVCCCSRKTV